MKKADFIYDEQNRQHTLDGKHIPSVTQIIEHLYDFRGITSEVLERKAELGKEFHEAIRLHLLDDLDFDSLDPDIVKPMKTFIRWIQKTLIHRIPNNQITAYVEKPIYHKTLKYCGKPDLILPQDLYDWKLRLYNRHVDTLQLTAYDHMAGGKARRKWALSFDLSGKMTTHKVQNRYAWGIFRRMLERYYSEQEFYKLMELWKGMNR